MFVLIDEDEMQVIAKHPNFAILYELSIIMSAATLIVTPLDMQTLDNYSESELRMLYISTTLKSRDEYPQYEQLKRLMLEYLNEIPETRLDGNCVSAQASYAIKWGLEGYCSYKPGKREPDLEESEFPVQIVDRPLEWESASLSSTEPVAFKVGTQAPFKAGQE